MFNPKDPLHSNPFNPNPLHPNSKNIHHRKITANPFLTNNSVSATRWRHDNLGLNSSIQHNTFINDITHVIIDSRNRNHNEYPIPNNYKIEMSRLFSNIKRIRLIDINMSNSIPPLNLRNNSLIWEYPSSEEASQINNINIPTSSLGINKIFFGINIPEGFYTTNSLPTLLENLLSNIPHKTEFDEAPSGSNHRFTVRINPQTQVVHIVNRIETLPVYAIQTILTASDDVFASFRVGPAPIPAACDDAFIVTFKKKLMGDPYPLVITDSPVIADISSTIINFQTYFEESIGENLEYELFDELLINSITYYRYKFRPENLLIQESQNIIFSLAGGNLMQSLNNTNLFNYSNNIINRPLIGRALPFRLLFQRSQLTDNECLCSLNPINEDGTLRTVLELLGWNIKNNDPDAPNTVLYEYIQSNRTSYLNPDVSFSSTVNGTEFSLPNNLLRLENRDEVFYFRSDDYIFLRILINDDQAEWGNQLILAGPIETPENDPTNIYYNVNLNNRVSDAQKLQTKDTNNLFAKINLSHIPGNNSNIVNDFITYDIDFKNEQLDELKEIRIQFIDREGRILNLRGDHNFVLEIITKRNVLENILFNSKNG